MLLSALGASSFGNFLAIIYFWAGEGFLRVGYGSSFKNKDFECHFIL